MNLSELFVRRPVMTVLVMAGILIFGLASYRLLPVSSLPNVDFPTIQVSAQLPGARSEEHTSELQSRFELVCRLLLEKKNMATMTRFLHIRRGSATQCGK